MLVLGKQTTQYPTYMLLKDCYKVFRGPTGVEVNCAEFQKELETMVGGLQQDRVFQYWTNPSGNGETPVTQYGAGLRVQHDVTSTEYVDKHHTVKGDSCQVAVSSLTHEEIVSKSSASKFVGQMLKAKCYSSSPLAAGVMVLLAQRVPAMVLSEATVPAQISVVSFDSVRAKQLGTGCHRQGWHLDVHPNFLRATNPGYIMFVGVDDAFCLWILNKFTGDDAIALKDVPYKEALSHEEMARHGDAKSIKCRYGSILFLALPVVHAGMAALNAVLLQSRVWRWHVYLKDNTVPATAVGNSGELLTFPCEAFTDEQTINRLQKDKN
jgi:hypothetical protein